MAYATVQHMIDRYGLAELKQLAPLQPTAPPGYDVGRVEQVLDDASAELDSHLAIRYPVPLAQAPVLIERAACDLAREALDRTGREHVLAAGKRVRGWIKDVAAGRATLGSGHEGSSDAAPVATSGGVEVMAPDRVFTDASLQGFLS